MKKLIYQVEGYAHIYNEGTDEVEKIPSLSLVTVEDPTDREIEQASKIAYNGEYTIEDDGQPEPEPEPEQGGHSVWDELDAAYTAGYETGYTEGVNEAYDQ